MTHRGPPQLWAGRPTLPVTVAALAIAASSALVLPVGGSIVLAACVIAGLATMSVARLRHSVSAAHTDTPGLREAARGEGVTSGALQLGAALLTIAIPDIAPTLGTTDAGVQRAIGIATAIAAMVVVLMMVRLRRRPEELPGSWTGIAAFGAGVAGLLVAALAAHIWVLVVATALMGLALALNSRWRFAAMRRFPTREGRFEAVTHVWSLHARIVGLAVLGGLAWSPMGWRGAAAVLAIVVALLGLAVLRGRLRAVEPPVPGAAMRRYARRPKEGGALITRRSVRVDPTKLTGYLDRWARQRIRSVGEARVGVRRAAAARAILAARRGRRVAPSPRSLDRLLCLASVRRYLGVVALATATASMAAATLAPALKAGGLGDLAPICAALIIAASQMLTSRGVARITARSDDSAREATSRASAWLIVAGVIALPALQSGAWWLTFPLALGWLSLSELALGGVTGATRTGLNKAGQLAGLAGVVTFYVGTAAGPFLASTPWASSPAGLAILLLAGGIATTGLAYSSRGRRTDDRCKAFRRQHTITLTPTTTGVTAVVAGGKPPASFDVLHGSDALRGHTRFVEGLKLSERMDLLWVETHEGPPSVLRRAQAWAAGRLRALIGRTGYAGGLAPLSRVYFRADGYHGIVTWAGAGWARVAIATDDARVAVIQVTIPMEETGNLTYNIIRALDLSDAVNLASSPDPDDDAASR